MMIRPLWFSLLQLSLIQSVLNAHNTYITVDDEQTIATTMTTNGDTIEDNISTGKAGSDTRKGMLVNYTWSHDTTHTLCYVNRR